MVSQELKLLRNLPHRQATVHRFILMEFAASIRKLAAKMARILIVEPDEVLRRLIASSLQTEGHSTVETSTSADAWDRLRKTEGFDLVIAELDLKPFSGVKLARLIEMNHVPVRIFFMCDDRGVAGALSAALGTRFLLEKPFTSEELLRQVNRVLEGKAPNAFSARRSGAPPATGRYRTRSAAARRQSVDAP
jgi:DNA-binding NtrC family response regulator